MFRAGLSLLLLPATLVMAAPARAGEDWPQFRGPRGDGTATAGNLPLVWSKTNNIAWKVPVPGCGRSSPVAQGGHIWLTSALGQVVRRTRIGPDDMQTAEHITLKAICLDCTDGKIVWETTLFDVDKPAPVHWLNSWATPTPVVEPGRLYCDFGTYGTACVDSTTGKVRWQQHLPLDHQVGPGSSPVLWQNLLLLVRDGRDAQYVTALDTKTGQTVWKTDRPPINTPTTDLRKAFSTPLLIRSGERHSRLTGSTQKLTAVEYGGVIHRYRPFCFWAQFGCFRHSLKYFPVEATPFAVKLSEAGHTKRSTGLWNERISGPVD